MQKMNNNQILANRMLEFLLWYEDYNSMHKEDHWWENPFMCPPRKAVDAMMKSLETIKDLRVSFGEYVNEKITALYMGNGGFRVYASEYYWLIILRGNDGSDCEFSGKL